ncbi:NAD(P)/FAD-dependent oxidoreductase [Desulfobaculum bizertense]|uniref:Thioredoxin reductase (NADPH) n=1 Tax=Desulfobaculum bizertense DSM 18034 TaxID=1121442 RepID=A0A1T4VR77_9BACT|nr:FAD-dependent oxidoreductase [Desulfobaculum bizertense]SKA67447.1 thioredoxin reductase (NADPH) [Desulfobaculum bizertense DSM 18034]
MCEVKKCDLVILGGGPAGMTAAIYAARANLDVVLLEENVTGGLVNSTYTVENFPSYPSIHGMELMEKMRAHVDSLDVTVEEVCEIESLSLDGERKIVETDEGTYSARAIILATGRKPIPLDVPTECDQVHHCAICDGAPYKGKRVLVVGGGNSAFDESLYMLTLGIEHITLIEKMDRFFAAQATQDSLLSSGKVDGRTSTQVVDLVVEDDELKAAILENTATGEKETVPVDGIFVFLGQCPNNEMFRDSITLSDRGYIVTDEHMSTNLPGVFSAGDINNKVYRQITTAISDGTIAALAAEHFLRD